jgi:hypothetical protein
MNSEFNWWLLLVGIVVGAALSWLVLADLGERPGREPIDESELELEADWIAARFAERDRSIDAEALTDALRLDRLYRSDVPRLAPTRPRPRRAPSPPPPPEDES